MAIVGRAKYTRARAKFRGDATRGERRKIIFGAPFASCLLEILRARVCISPAPQLPSPNLETTRSLHSTAHRLSAINPAFCLVGKNPLSPDIKMHILLTVLHTFL